MTTMNIEQVRTALLHAARACGSQAALAQRLGVDQSYINNVLNGRRTPSQKVLDYFGLERVVTYRRKEPA